jgi:putative inorganic carbon (hco3(-)) transporter
MALRDIALFLIIFGSIPLMIRKPFIGVLFWAWIGVMNPHRLSWGLAFNFPFAQLIGGVTILSLLFTSDERRWKAGPEVYMLIALLAWMCVTTIFALEPASAALEWKRVMKIQVMTFVILLVLHTRQHVTLLTIVLALSVGYFGVKGGIFTILTGGNYKVWGPFGSFLEDNNALALATVMAIPLFYFMATETTKKWLRLALWGAMGLCALSALGSYSRGALLALASMCVILWWNSRHKVLLGLALVVVAPLMINFMPSQWSERMDTIVHHQGEGSADARIATWTMLFRLANDRFFGGGFELYSRRTFDMYMPEWPTVHSAHSIYFEILGEHGYIGLAMFLTMWFLVWRSCRWIIKECKPRPDLKWAFTLASMIQVSLVAYFVGGTFLGLAYWDFPYYLLAVVVVTRDIVRRAIAVPAPSIATEGQPVVPVEEPDPRGLRPMPYPAPRRLPADGPSNAR